MAQYVKQLVLTRPPDCLLDLPEPCTTADGSLRTTAQWPEMRQQSSPEEHLMVSSTVELGTELWFRPFATARILSPQPLEPSKISMSLGAGLGSLADNLASQGGELLETQASQGSRQHRYSALPLPAAAEALQSLPSTASATAPTLERVLSGRLPNPLGALLPPPQLSANVAAAPHAFLALASTAVAAAAAAATAGQPAQNTMASTAAGVAQAQQQLLAATSLLLSREASSNVGALSVPEAAQDGRPGATRLLARQGSSAFQPYQTSGTDSRTALIRSVSDWVAAQQQRQQQQQEGQQQQGYAAPSRVLLRRNTAPPSLAGHAARPDTGGSTAMQSDSSAGKPEAAVDGLGKRKRQGEPGSEAPALAASEMQPPKLVKQGSRDEMLACSAASIIHTQPAAQPVTMQVQPQQQQPKPSVLLRPRQLQPSPSKDYSPRSSRGQPSSSSTATQQGAASGSMRLADKEQSAPFRPTPAQLAWAAGVYVQQYIRRKQSMGAAASQPALPPDALRILKAQLLSRCATK